MADFYDIYLDKQINPLSFFVNFFLQQDEG